VPSDNFVSFREPMLLCRRWNVFTFPKLNLRVGSTVDEFNSGQNISVVGAYAGECAIANNLDREDLGFQLHKAGTPYAAYPDIWDAAAQALRTDAQDNDFRERRWNATKGTPYSKSTGFA
jgi:hypothetical protein